QRRLYFPGAIPGTSVPQCTIEYRKGQFAGFPLDSSKPIVRGGSRPSGSPPPQLPGAGRTSASFQSARVNQGSSLGHSGSCGDSEYCTLVKPEMPTWAIPVIGID